MTLAEATELGLTWYLMVCSVSYDGRQWYCRTSITLNERMSRAWTLECMRFHLRYSVCDVVDEASRNTAWFGKDSAWFAESWFDDPSDPYGKAIRWQEDFA